MLHSRMTLSYALTAFLGFGARFGDYVDADLIGTGEEANASPSAKRGNERKLRAISGKKPKLEEAPTCSTCPTYDIRKVTTDQGLGESPGIPSLEYLGIGYNIFEGNPRGSDISESDPGFRHSVIRFLQAQDQLSIDQKYMVPFGVQVKYSTACKFASEATELSSELQYQSEISKEAKQSTELNVGASLPLFSISAEYAFSSSAKYKEFKESTISKETVTYEAKALCSEFEASLKPYVNHDREMSFEEALTSLTLPWTNSTEQRKEYAKFFKSFGTHYVTDVKLGAKHVFSSVMTAKDVVDLTRSEIDIESSLSWSAQVSVGSGATGNVEFGQLPRSEASGTVKGVEVKAFTYVFEEASASAGVKETRENKENQKSSTMEKVKSRVKTVSEMNIGGNPPSDGNWKTWAATVRDRPMPVAYTLTGLWNLMTDANQTDAFYQAMVELYELDLRKKKNESVLNTLHFGVASKDGSPISSYNRDPSSNYRALLELNVVEAEQIEAYTTKNIVKDTDEELNVEDECEGTDKWTEFISSPIAGYFACGVAAYLDPSNKDREGGDDYGIVDLKIKFCSTRDWLLNQQEEIYVGTGTLSKLVMCKKDQFIAYVDVKSDKTANDQNGIDGLSIFCVTKDGTEEEMEIYKDNTCGAGQTDSGRVGRPDGRNDMYVAGARVRHCKDLGIFGLDLLFKAVRKPGPIDNFYSYDLSWQGDSNKVSAVFASMVRGKVSPNTNEDEMELGFVLRSSTSGSNIFNVESYFPYGLMTDRTRAKIAVQDFKNTLYKEELQSFSFLTGDNLPEESTYVAGVVHPQGYAVNDVFQDSADIGYRISQESNQEFTIKFPNAFDESPTFLLFPLWFPGIEMKYPSNVGDIAVATRNCTDSECSLVTGAFQDGGVPAVAEQFLGFSFIALDGSLKADTVGGIVHGMIAMQPTDPTKIDFNASVFNDGFEAEAKFSDPQAFTILYGEDNLRTIKLTEQKAGGVLIKFKNAFRGTPSVVLSPIIGKRAIEHGGVDSLAAPYAIVEHVNEESAFVKVGWIDTIKACPVPSACESIYEPLSFYIVAVGPQRDPFGK